MWLSVMSSFEEQNHYIFCCSSLNYSTQIVVCTCFQEQKAWSALKSETTKFLCSILSSCFASCLFPGLHLLALTSPRSGFTLKLMPCILSTLFYFAALLTMYSVSCFPSELEAL